MNELIQLIRTALKLKTPIHAETPLLSSGLIDSFKVVVLLSALEQQYGVAIPVENIDVDTFDTPAQILATVEREK